MLLAIDLGNTNTVLGLYDRRRLVKSWRLSTEKNRTRDEYGLLVRNLLSIEGIDAGLIAGIVIASVVPLLDATLEDVAITHFKVQPLFVTADNAGIPILYDDPAEVGADRVVNAVAVLDRYAVPAIIVDLGTATTFDAVTAAGEYLGGLIAPGIRISATALVDQAARLPRFDIKKPEVLIGRSTAGSLESGFFWGYVALVDGLIERMQKELGEETTIIATGGMAHFVREGSRWISTIDSDLTLTGLQLVAERLGVG